MNGGLGGWIPLKPPIGSQVSWSQKNMHAKHSMSSPEVTPNVSIFKIIYMSGYVWCAVWCLVLVNSLKLKHPGSGPTEALAHPGIHPPARRFGDTPRTNMASRLDVLGRRTSELTESPLQMNSCLSILFNTIFIYIIFIYT